MIAVARGGRESAETWKALPYDGVRLQKALMLLVRDRRALRVCYEAVFRKKKAADRALPLPFVAFFYRKNKKSQPLRMTL